MANVGDKIGEQLTAAIPEAAGLFFRLLEAGVPLVVNALTAKVQGDAAAHERLLEQFEDALVTLQGGRERVRKRLADGDRAVDEAFAAIPEKPETE